MSLRLALSMVNLEALQANMDAQRELGKRLK